MPFAPPAQYTHKASAERFRDVTELVHHTLKLLDKQDLVRVSPIFLPEVSDILYKTCCLDGLRTILAESVSRTGSL